MLEQSEHAQESNKAYFKSNKKKGELQREFRKIEPHTFNGEREEDVEEWLLNMTKYIQVYEYESNLKARLVVYQLQGKSKLWWEEIKIIHFLDERTISWEEFRHKFKSNLSEIYNDGHEKYFHELRLGQLTMDEFVTKFTNLLWHVPYI